MSSTSISPSDKEFEKMFDDNLQNCFKHFSRNNKEHYCISMYYDIDEGKYIMKILNKISLCNQLYGILQQAKDYYDHNPRRTETFVELEYFSSALYQDFKVVSFINVYGDEIIQTECLKKYFVCKDLNAIVVIDGILKLCDNRDDLNNFIETIEIENDMLYAYNSLYQLSMYKKGDIEKKVKKEEKKVKKEETSREEIPREEIPREKTLSKKEKEKLKKQKAKEANKLREQEKKDKAKLAEQQAKQFEKQQKERERKRIETARKKKLALLKK